MKIADLVIESHARAHRKGFYDEPPTVLERLALIHSEVSEAAEAFRDGQLTTTINPATGKPEGLPSELADIIIRVCDFAGHLGVDLAHEIQIKAAYNETRPRKHNKAC